MWRGRVKGIKSEKRRQFLSSTCGLVRATRYESTKMVIIMPLSETPTTLQAASFLMDCEMSAVSVVATHVPASFISSADTSVTIKITTMEVAVIIEQKVSIRLKMPIASPCG